MSSTFVAQQMCSCKYTPVSVTDCIKIQYVKGSVRQMVVQGLHESLTSYARIMKM